MFTFRDGVAVVFFKITCQTVKQSITRIIAPQPKLWGIISTLVQS
jgi:hypothetical protein